MPNTIFMDSFAHYDISDIGRKYDEVPAIGAMQPLVTGRVPNSGGFRFLAAANSLMIRKYLPNGFPSLWLEAAFRFYTFPPDPPSQSVILSIGHDDSSSFNIQLQFTAAGELVLADYLGNTLWASSGLALSAGNWYHAGIRVTVHPTYGEWEVRLNGVPLASGTGSTSLPGSSYANWIALGNVWNSDTDFCDLVVSGDSFSGNAHVVALHPILDGTHAGWTASAGTPVSCVDETASNDDVDYIHSMTGLTRASFVFEPLSLQPGVILAVQHVSTARRDSATPTRSVRQFVRTFGVDYDQPPQALEEEYRMLISTMPLAPGGGNWTPDQLQAFEAGISLETQS